MAVLPLQGEVGRMLSPVSLLDATLLQIREHRELPPPAPTGSVSLTRPAGRWLQRPCSGGCVFCLSTTFGLILGKDLNKSPKEQRLAAAVSYLQRGTPAGSCLSLCDCFPCVSRAWELWWGVCWAVRNPSIVPFHLAMRP